MSKAAELAALIGSQTALSNRNLIINGAMTVAQRNTSATGKTTGGYFTVDRSKFDLVNLGTHTYSQSTDAPEGFSNSLRVDCTATASLSADSLLYALAQGIEGQNLQLLKKGTSNAESVTVSFYVKSNKTGTYVLEIYDGMNTRHIAKTYTINSANTWEYKTLTFAGDTSGTLTNSNAFGIGLFFWVGAGSNYTTGTLPSSWASVTNANRAAGLNVNMADSTDNDWSITGVKLEVGNTATPFEHRSFGEELALCQRYFQSFKTGRVNTSLVSVASSTSQAVITMPLQVESRVLASYDGALAAGTFTKTGTVTVNGFPSNGDNVTGIAFWVCNSTEITVGLNTSATLVQYNGYVTRIGATAGETVFTLDVEL
jgi:hypothetical protein